MTNQSSNTCQDCNECLQILQLVADNEADARQMQFFHEHMQNCERCKHCYKIETGLRDCLKESLAQTKVPKELENIIRSQILTGKNS